MLEILCIESRGILLFKQRATKILICSLICVFDGRICQKSRHEESRAIVALWATYLLRGTIIYVVA